MNYNKSISKIVICPHCKGAGFTTTREFRGHSEGWCTEDTECNYCAGSGKMMQQVNIQYKQIKSNDVQ